MKSFKMNILKTIGETKVNIVLPYDPAEILLQAYTQENWKHMVTGVGEVRVVFLTISAQSNSNEVSNPLTHGEACWLWLLSF